MRQDLKDDPRLGVLQPQWCVYNRRFMHDASTSTATPWNMTCVTSIAARAKPIPNS